MTSLRYNTFNDNDQDIVEQQCLICLQSSSNSKDEIKSITEMHFLKKKCNCICYSHHKCIETWIETNSVCPICKKPLFFPQNKVEDEKNETLINIPLINENQTQNQNQNPCRESAPTYMCMMCLVFTILFLGNVITAIIYK
jgi:hypothetical protein